MTSSIMKPTNDFLPNGNADSNGGLVVSGDLLVNGDGIVANGDVKKCDDGTDLTETQISARFSRRMSSDLIIAEYIKVSYSVYQSL